MNPFWTRYHESMTAIWNYCEEVGFFRFLGEIAGGIAFACFLGFFLGYLLWSIPAFRLMLIAILSALNTLSLIVIHTGSVATMLFPGRVSLYFLIFFVCLMQRVP